MRELSAMIFRCCVATGMVLAGWAGYQAAAGVDPQLGGKARGDTPSKPAGRGAMAASTGLAADLADLSKRMDDEKLRPHQAWAAIKDLPAERILEELLPLTKDMSSSLGEFHMMMLFRWAQLEPHAAMDYAECFPNLLDAGPARATVFTSWWKSDPTGAYQWALSEPAAKRQRLGWVVSVLKKEAADMPLRRAKEQGQDALEAMALDLVRTASDQAAMDRLMDSAGSPETRETLRQAVLARDLKMAPPDGTPDDLFAETHGNNALSLQDALEKLVAAELSPEDTNRILNRKLPEWSRIRGEEVMTWLVEQEGFGASERQRDCLNQWFFARPEEATEWLFAEGEAGSLYEGIASTARRIHAAVENGTLYRVNEGDKTEEMASAILSRWASFDPAAVERWRQGGRRGDLRASGGIQTDRFQFESEGF
jgi:hypothetical protein